MTALPPTERQIAHQVLLDRWNPNRLAWKLANHHGLKPSAVERLLTRPDFQAEVAKQKAIYEGRYPDLAVADRHTRVADLSRLLERIPAKRVRLKLKILDALRREVGDA